MDVVRNFIAQQTVAFNQPYVDGPSSPTEVPEDDDEVPEVVVVSERGYEVDPRQPVTPPASASTASRTRSHPFPPLPPRGSLATGILVRPRAPAHPAWLNKPPLKVGGRPYFPKQRAKQTTQATTSKTPAPKWRPKQTTAPRMPGQFTHHIWGRSAQGKRPGHINAQGVWVGRNKGRKRQGWPAKANNKL